MKAIFILIFLPFILFGCDKIKSGITTTISGNIIDTVKHKNLKDVTVVIMGHYWGRSVSIDTFHSIDGQYKMTFVTDGNYISYSVGLFNSTKYLSSGIEKYITVGRNNTLNLYPRELNVLKAKVKVSNCPFQNLLVATEDCGAHYLHKSTIDTTLLFGALPKSYERIYFINWANSNTFYIDSIYIDLKDTTFYQKTIFYKDN